MSTVKAINLQHPSSANPNIVLDNGGRVGIGSSSPNTSILVTGSSSTHSIPSLTDVPAIHVFNSNTSSNTAHAIIGVRTNTANGGNPFISFDVAGVFGYSVGIDNADSDKFKIQTGWNGFGGVGIQLDTSGRVTMPSQPAFYAWLNTATSTFSADTTIVYNATRFNIGTHYNTSTGRFTAPVSGIYIFTATVANDPDGAIEGKFFYFTRNGSRIDGRDIAESEISSQVTHYEQHATWIAQLSAGDYVDIRSSASVTFANGQDGPPFRNQFSGYLLG